MHPVVSRLSFLAFVGILAGSSWSQPYVVEQIPVLPGYETTLARAVNRHGVVVGRATDFMTGKTTAFRYSNGVVEDLGTLPDHIRSEAVAINESGVVVGRSSPPSGIRAMKVVGNTMSELLGTTGWAEATGINDLGDIVGVHKGNSLTQGFVLRDGIFSELPTLEPGGFTWATDINENRQITGYSGVLGSHAYAFRLTDGSMVKLENLGGVYDFALAINNHGTVVGRAEQYDQSVALSFSVAFVYDDFGMKPIPGLGSGFSVAHDINDSGEIVGSVGGSPNWAFLHKGGSTYDLNDLLLNGGGINLETAYGIASDGTIVAVGTNEFGDYRSYLLHPVPEPGFAFMAGIGLFVARRSFLDRLRKSRSAIASVATPRP